MDSRNELYHHGIKGQQKGVRRFQYEDNRLTPAGKERYGQGTSLDTGEHVSRSVKIANGVKSAVKFVKKAKRVHALKKANRERAKERQEAKKREKKGAKAVRSTDSDKIEKNFKNMTVEQMREARERLKLKQQMSQDKFDNLVRKADNLATIAKKVADYKGIYDKLVNAFDVNKGMTDDTISKILDSGGDFSKIADTMKNLSTEQISRARAIADNAKAIADNTKKPQQKENGELTDEQIQAISEARGNQSALTEALGGLNNAQLSRVQNLFKTQQQINQTGGKENKGKDNKGKDNNGNGQDNAEQQVQTTETQTTQSQNHETQTTQSQNHETQTTQSQNHETQTTQSQNHSQTTQSQNRGLTDDQKRLAEKIRKSYAYGTGWSDAKIKREAKKVGINGQDALDQFFAMLNGLGYIQHSALGAHDYVIKHSGTNLLWSVSRKGAPRRDSGMRNHFYGNESYRFINR